MASADAPQQFIPARRGGGVEGFHPIRGSIFPRFVSPPFVQICVKNGGTLAGNRAEPPVPIQRNLRCGSGWFSLGSSACGSGGGIGSSCLTGRTTCGSANYTAPCWCREHSLPQLIGLNANILSVCLFILSLISMTHTSALRFTLPRTRFPPRACCYGNPGTV